MSEGVDSVVVGVDGHGEKGASTNSGRMGCEVDECGSEDGMAGFEEGMVFSFEVLGDLRGALVLSTGGLYGLRVYAAPSVQRTPGGRPLTGPRHPAFRCATSSYGSHVLSPAVHCTSNWASAWLPTCRIIRSTAHSRLSPPSSGIWSSRRPGNFLSSLGMWTLSNDE